MDALSGGAAPVINAGVGSGLMVLCAWGLWRAGRRFAGASAPEWERGAAGFVLLAWGGYVLFELLAALGLFRKEIVWGVLAVTGLWGLYGGRLGSPIRPPPAAPTRRGISAKWEVLLPLLGLTTGLLVIVGWAALRLLRGLAAPPLAWDALTYHLPRAVEWVQSGRLVESDFPGAWEYYRHFPRAADALWAWGFAATRGDVALAALSAATWVLLGAGAYALTRSIGARPRQALLAMAVLTGTPAALAALTACYPDNLYTGLLLLGLAYTVAYTRRPDARRGALALMALSMALAVRPGALPLVLVAIAALVTAWIRSGERRSAQGWIASALIALPMVQVIEHAARFGNPLYPLALPLGFVTLPGHELLTATLTGTEAGLRPLWWEMLRLAERLIIPSPPPAAGIINLGIAFPVLLAVGMAGAWRARRLRTRVPADALLLLGAAIVIPGALLMLPGVAALRNEWSMTAGRLLLVPVGVLAALAAAFGPTWVRWMLGVLLASNAGFSWPLHFGDRDWAGVLEVTSLLGALVLTALLAAWLLSWRWKHHLTACLFVAVAAGLGAAWLVPLREDFRGDAYLAQHWGQMRDVHRIPQRFTAVYGEWERLAAAHPETVAVAAGFEHPGHNVMLYPLYGARLQHRVISAANEGGPLGAKSADEWLASLRARDADTIILTAPLPPEGAWLEEAAAVGTALRLERVKMPARLLDPSRPLDETAGERSTAALVGRLPRQR